MTIYSHSRLSTFEQCPRKFKYRYIDKVTPEIDKTIEAHLGSTVHNTLEWIYNNVQELTLKIDEIIEKYTAEWQKDFSDDIKIVKKGITARDYYNKGIQFLVDYYSKNSPFKDGTIECEKGILIELDKEGKYKLQGFIDRLVYNLETGEYEVHDYKTANRLPTQNEADKDRQLALYSIAIKDIYGKEKEVKLIWHYLAHNTKIESKRTNEQLTQLKSEAVQLINKIEKTREFLPKYSMLCNWCEFRQRCLNQDIDEKFPTVSKYIKD